MTTQQEVLIRVFSILASIGLMTLCYGLGHCVLWLWDGLKPRFSKEDVRAQYENQVRRHVNASNFFVGELGPGKWDIRWERDQDDETKWTLILDYKSEKPSEYVPWGMGYWMEDP